jgi:hypothetical protein
MSLIIDYSPIINNDDDNHSVVNTNDTNKEKYEKPEEVYDYLEDVEKWGRPPVCFTHLKDYLWPITFDFFRDKYHLIFDPVQILHLEIARNAKITADLISVTPDNQQFIHDFLLKGKFLKPYPTIKEGVIAGGYNDRCARCAAVAGAVGTAAGAGAVVTVAATSEYGNDSDSISEDSNSSDSEESQEKKNSQFLIIISASNRRGDPGRLYILRETTDVTKAL